MLLTGNLEQLSDIGNMKTIGILGGMSAASTLVYYRRLCDLHREAKGGLASPDLLIRSVDFSVIEEMQRAGDWAAAGRFLNHAARGLKSGGAEILLLATNTMHKVADSVTEGVDLPFIHIADATAAEIVRAGFKRPGLMATAFTMEQRFYIERLEAAGLAPVIPSLDDRQTVHRIIYEELCRDEVREDSRLRFQQIAERLVQAGADSLILGCTEVGMLLHAGNVSVPVFDTVDIHCRAALAAAG